MTEAQFSYTAPLEDVESFKKSIVYKLIFLIGRSPDEASQRDWLNATLLAMRDLVTEGWISTAKEARDTKARRIYYLSMEFLMGRTLSNAMLSEGMYDTAKQALAQLDVDLEEVLEKEVDPGLGNGGLGRLAACFMDSIATLALPGMGYGIRYEYGMFRQHIEDGRQVEKPDAWLEKGSPWEFVRPSKRHTIRFGGNIHFEGKNASGKMRKKLLHLLTIISFRVTALRQQPPCVYGMRTQVICLTWLTLIKEIISVRLKSVLQLKTFLVYFILMILLGQDVNYAYARNIS